MASSRYEILERKLRGSVGDGQGRSLFQDAFKRLLRNKAAVLGGIIVIVLLVVAIFANKIAPQHFADTELRDNCFVPEWIVKVFPSMEPYA